VGLAVHWADLAEGEVDGWRTSPVRTVLDCAKTLPFDEALVVADSALRAGVAKVHLVSAAARLSTRGRQRCLRVVESASPRSANAFESALRAIALEVPGLRVEPQLPIDLGGFVVHPDLVDTALRLAIEADSFSWHGDRAALKRDCERYDELVAAGWRVLRFAWEQVMFEPEWVASMLARAAGQRAILPKSA
jgi:very-short-patch-repair endonuclease